MDIQMTTKEIGCFEVARNLSCVAESQDIVEKVGAFMPLPDVDVEARITEVSKWLLSFHKSKYFFLTPEIALASKMVELSDFNVEIVFALSADMDDESKNRLKSNLPNNTSVLYESCFPEDFFPRNGMLVVCGYQAAERPMVLLDTYRLIEHYSGFLGKKAFVPYVELAAAIRYEGWMEVKPQRVSVAFHKNGVVCT